MKVKISGNWWVIHKKMRFFIICKVNLPIYKQKIGNIWKINRNAG